MTKPGFPQKADLISAMLRSAQRTDGLEDGDSWWLPTMWDILTDHPENAWSIILDIVAIDSSPTVRRFLITGPLDVLLMIHGRVFGPRLEAEAQRNVVVRQLLDEMHQLTGACAEAWDKTEAMRAGDKTHSPAGTWPAFPQKIDLISAMIRSCHHDISLENPDSWAHSMMWDLGRERPEEVWPIILEIIAVDSSVRVMEYVAAGPLEDLLAEHGATFIERIEAEAHRNPAFRKLLGGVWQNSMSDELWHRVQTVWDRRGWDGIPEGPEENTA